MTKLRPLHGRKRAVHRANLVRLFPVLDAKLGTCCDTCDALIQDVIHLAGWTLTEYYQAWGAQEVSRGTR